MKILIRFDDICPTMDWEQWSRAEEILNTYGVKPLIGVIPDCKDPELQIDDPRPDFWEWVKQKQIDGYGIAMHGYTHVYDNHCRGCINNGFNTEFAGHTYKTQLEKISKGKEILESHGIYTDVFFAPSHSYDYNTLKALSACGFKYVSDGKSLKPIIRYGIKCLPTRDGSPRSLFPCSTDSKTYVFHAHEWVRKEKAAAYDKLCLICKNHSHDIVSTHEYLDIPCGNPMIQKIDEYLYMSWCRYLYPILSKTKRNFHF